MANQGYQTPSSGLRNSGYSLGSASESYIHQSDYANPMAYEFTGIAPNGPYGALNYDRDPNREADIPPLLVTNTMAGEPNKTHSSRLRSSSYSLDSNKEPSIPSSLFANIMTHRASEASSNGFQIPTEHSDTTSQRHTARPPSPNTTANQASTVPSHHILQPRYTLAPVSALPSASVSASRANPLNLLLRKPSPLKFLPRRSPLPLHVHIHKTNPSPQKVSPFPPSQTSTQSSNPRSLAPPPIPATPKRPSMRQ
jgi:hypothetical protein